MGYLEDKRNALLMNVQSGGGNTQIDIVTNTISGTNTSVDITVGGTTTNYVLNAINNKLINEDYYTIGYGQYSGTGSFYIWFKGNFDVNGITYTPYDLLHWVWNTSVDYSCVGQIKFEPQNTIKIKTMDRNANASGLIVGDENNYTVMFWNTTKYNKAIRIDYSSPNWKIIANQDVEYNGVTYTSGQTVTQWAYNTDVDLDITIL